ncbi:DHA2 family efflux MFS transporter permease subunit [Tunturiibacter gelidoferens]|uniref:DHA2 family multidrug resistance protein n=1 Tax=Tunturiibacter gelidiferens TaxID=3069689 RepID=A0ACC5NYC6_9BACT|nr:DHA2 family efflux MFS transporter permease subunit [Edaphobacter lichenicola]MBB5339429.1 DHA2 family multidrug resistance protein [Edaphobacter lichenicola]
MNATAGYKVKHNPWIIAVTVTLATIMEVLDTSIANVALPHIAGSLGASQDESTWVITSYLVANAVVLPVGAYLGTIIGRKRFYMTCVAVFGISSFLCGLAPSLPLLLFFRVIQGLGGGGLQPSEQSILADTFPPEKRGQAFAVYGLAVITAPIVGPTLGGWITDNYDWRWIFFINIPVAILSLFLTHRLIEDPPAIKEEVKAARRGGFKLDYIGFGLIALTFGSLEVVLDKGQQDDWFSSHFIISFLAVTVIGLACLVIWELRQERVESKPILDLRLFTRRNFSVSFLMMFVLGFTLYATTVLLPQLLQSLMGYTAESAGMAMSSGGLATIICMPIVGILISRVDGRYLIMFGFASIAVALFHMTSLDLQMSFRYAAVLRFYQSIGLAFLFVPINSMIYLGIDARKNNDVSGLSNLARNIGGSAGTSFFTTVLARHQQVHQTYLVQNVVGSSQQWMSSVHALTSSLQHGSAALSDAQRGACLRIYQSLEAQASVLSYIDVLSMLAVFCACMIPMALLMQKPPKGMQASAH